MALRFDALLKIYEQLAEMVLFTFRTDIRCQTIHYLNLYWMGQIPIARLSLTPHTVELMTMLQWHPCPNETAVGIRIRRLGCTDGTSVDLRLAAFRFVNDHGILRNVVALQQRLKTLNDGSRDTGLERA